LGDHGTPKSNDLAPERFGTAFKAFIEAVVQAAAPPESPLLERIRAHLDADLNELTVVAEEFDTFEHPNVQVAVDAVLTAVGRDRELIGVSSDHKFYMKLGLSDLLSRDGSYGRPALTEGPVDYVNYHLHGGESLPCVQFGLYLVSEGDERAILFIVGPAENGNPNQKVRVESMAKRQEYAQLLLAELKDATFRLNVYRGHLISLSPGDLSMGPQTLVAFHTLPSIRREDVILPDGVLDRIERQSVVFSKHADRLKAAGRSLKRGILLHGPPGTGKTLTVMYLSGQMPGRTVILTTGLGMGLLRPVIQMARMLVPAMVVLEDVDLIAEERGNPWGRGGTLLYELLNELDGLHDDCDVIFIMTTNRPEVLEPALADRPGRVDLAVELPLPDEDGRRKLLELYGQGLVLKDIDLRPVVERTAGASPAFIKELWRRAALLAAESDGNLVVRQDHLDQALAELTSGNKLSHRVLGFQGEQGESRHRVNNSRHRSDPFGTL
jgi:hypothetical protein